MILLAQEFAGCFYINRVGDFIDLNAICQIQEVQPITPPTPRLTQSQIYLTIYETNYCDQINNNISHLNASEIAHNLALDKVIELRGNLTELLMDASLWEKVNQINCD